MRSNNNMVRFGSRSFILTAALILILGCTISGTVAWMFTKAEPVSNTFTYGAIEIELTETDTKDDDDDEKTNTYSFTPGAVIAKDPLVTVKAGEESCWLFVKVSEGDTFDDYLEYQLAEGWKALAGEDGIYYREVAASDQDQTFEVLKGNVVTVKSSVTQEALDVLTAEDFPTLQFAAYAIQHEGVATAAEAWGLVEK